MPLKICFAGLGSIGTRHLRNLTRILQERGALYEIHALRSSQRELPPDVKRLISREFYPGQEIDHDYDIALITTPTAQHYDMISFFLPRARHLFIEKPLFESTRRDLNVFGLHGNGIFYVAAPLRHTAVFDAIQKFVSAHRIYCARAICSSYLPEWRREVDYRKIYSAVAEQGGGVNLDLIHEWDYLCSLFGRPNQIQCACGHYSSLEIDSNDLAVYIGIYPDKVVELHLDYFGRSQQRTLQLFAEECVFTADFLKNCVTRSCAGETQTTMLPVKDAYIREMNYFLDLCLGLQKENRNPPSMAYETLKIALGEIV